MKKYIYEKEIKPILKVMERPKLQPVLSLNVIPEEDIICKFFIYKPTGKVSAEGYQYKIVE